MNQEKNGNGTQKSKVYHEEFKLSVVDHWCHGDKTAEQVGQEFGIKVWNE